MTSSAPGTRTAHRFAAHGVGSGAPFRFGPPLTRHAHAFLGLRRAKLSVSRPRVAHARRLNVDDRRSDGPPRAGRERPAKARALRVRRPRLTHAPRAVTTGRGEMLPWSCDMGPRGARVRGRDDRRHGHLRGGAWAQIGARASGCRASVTKAARRSSRRLRVRRRGSIARRSRCPRQRRRRRRHRRHPCTIARRGSIPARRQNRGTNS